MTSNSQFNPENQSFADSESVSAHTTGKTSRSAVPIFVYQQLVENLQHTQEELEQLKQVNQELVGQNQQLRQEIITILQAVEQVQQNVIALNIPQFSTGKNTVKKVSAPTHSNLTPPITETPIESIVPNSSNSNMISEFESSVMEEKEDLFPAPIPSSSKIKATNSSSLKVRKKHSKPPVKKEFKKEMIEGKDHDQDLDQENNANTLNGWLFFLAILLIVLTAFGAGFIVMRPLLNPINPPPSATSNPQ